MRGKFIVFFPPRACFIQGTEITPPLLCSRGWVGAVAANTRWKTAQLLSPKRKPLHAPSETRTKKKSLVLRVATSSPGCPSTSWASSHQPQAACSAHTRRLRRARPSCELRPARWLRGAASCARVCARANTSGEAWQTLPPSARGGTGATMVRVADNGMIVHGRTRTRGASMRPDEISFQTSRPAC